MFLVPSYLPLSVEIGQGDIQLDFANKEGYGAVVGRRDSEASFRDVVTVSVYAAKADREVGAEEREVSERVMVGDHEARLVQSGPTGTMLDWFQDGMRIGLVGPPDFEEVVVELARSLRLTPQSPAETALGDLPEGYEVVDQSRNPKFDRDSYSIRLSSKEPGGLEFGSITVTVVPRGMSPVTSTAARETLKLLRVRGVDAAMSQTRSEVAGPAGSQKLVQRVLAWLEHEDLMIAVHGMNLAEGELVKLAEGLQETTEQEWRRQIPAGVDDEPSTLPLQPFETPSRPTVTLKPGEASFGRLSA